MSWEGYGRKRLWPNQSTYPSICLEELKKTMKILRIVGVPYINLEHHHIIILLGGKILCALNNKNNYKKITTIIGQ
jgi:hypothetical protein